ncbi:MAG: S9 family peptidase [Deltaproteobacteria bacterium]|nr:MAG: S9 family peptidase [Deltaproteobacteria bacterium]
MAAEDPRLWLEDVEGETALEWVKARNHETVEALTTNDAFESTKSALLEIYDSTDRIPSVSERGGFLYNFWRDAEHPRGLWRRTTLESYKTDAPEWDVLLDFDKLAADESENWVFAGARCLAPAHTKCLVTLSRGGADASVTREFDLNTRSFVEGGFVLPEAKGGLSWIDADTVYVATDFGEGSMTDSGYPRIVKRWKRGTALAEAEVVFEGDASNISVGAYHDDEPGYERDFVYQGLTFFTRKLYEVTPKGLWEVPKQDSADAAVHKDWILVNLREDWTVGGETFAQGSLIAADYKKFKKGKAQWVSLFTPSETTSLEGYDFTRDHLVLTVLDDVVNRVEILTPTKKGAWERSEVEGLPEGVQVSAAPVNGREGNDLWFNVDGYLTPTSLWRGTVGGKPEQLKQTPSWFDEARFEVSQHFATSKDGTRVPYFQIAPKDQDGPLPTLQYGYGGFEVSMLPSYSGTRGVGWLERGGVYVIANIRGGGEYGPRWHQAALKEKRHRAYEDFAAVAEDLVKRGVTTHNQLGAMGGSNGGLLMGNMYTLYPELWGGIVCQVPLLDMKRYTKLLAGASWAGEYGDPDDPAQWEFIQTFSPYHNIDASKDYPPILFTTSTRDDRVHPGHARKMAHALLEAGKDVEYYENIEGGHGGAANNEQSAFMGALAYEFLWQTLSGERPVLGEETPILESDIPE